MANMPINCFPRNVTLERSSEGYVLLGEIDKHDVVEDVYLNLYSDSMDKFEYKNSEGSNDFVTWQTNPPYHVNNNLIKAKISDTFYPEETLLKISVKQVQEQNKCLIDTDEDILKIPVFDIYLENQHQGTIYHQFKLNKKQISRPQPGSHTSTIIYSTWESSSPYVQWLGCCFIETQNSQLTYVDNASSRMFWYFRMDAITSDSLGRTYEIKMVGARQAKWTFSYKNIYYNTVQDVIAGTLDPVDSMDKYTSFCSVHIPFSGSITFKEQYNNHFSVTDTELAVASNNSLLKSPVNWSYTLHSQSYDRYVLSGFTDDGSEEGYIGISNALGVESGQMFNKEYLIDVLPESKYYYNQRAEQIEKTGPVNGFYTYKVSWTGDKLPTSQKDYLKISVNTYVYDLKELSEYSIKFESKIDLLGEEIESAKAVILLYTPMTYITLKNLNDESIEIDDSFKNLEYIITSNLLEGEINSFKIADSREVDLQVIFDKERRMKIIEQVPLYDINWYQVLLKSNEKVIYLSEKKYENYVDFSYSCNWSPFLTPSSKINIQINLQFKNGVSKQITTDYFISLPSYSELVFGQVQKNGVLLKYPWFFYKDQNYIYYYSVSETETRDIFNMELSIDDENDIYETAYLKFKMDSEAKKIIFLDENDEEILSFEDTYISEKKEDAFTGYYFIDEITPDSSLFKDNVLLKKDFSTNVMDYSIKNGSQYDLESSLLVYLAKYGDTNPIEVKFRLLEHTLYIFSIQDIFIDKPLIGTEIDVNGIHYSFSSDFTSLFTSGNTLNLISLTPKFVTASFTLDNIDFIPTCLFGTKYNYEENKENRYEVDKSQIWYFDLDTKANSIDFVNEHTVQPTLSGLPKVGVSPTNYMSQTITTKLGYLDEDDMYVGDDGWKLNKFAEWANDGSVKILRLRNGYLIPVDIQLKTNVANHNVVGEPSDITFTWTQIADHKTAVLYGYE